MDLGMSLSFQSQHSNTLIPTFLKVFSLIALLNKLVDQNFLILDA